jgi:hypothetical protein
MHKTFLYLSLVYILKYYSTQQLRVKYRKLFYFVMDCVLLNSVIIILVRKFIHNTKRKIQVFECQFSLFQTDLFHKIFTFNFLCNYNICKLKEWTTLYIGVYKP